MRKLAVWIGAALLAPFALITMDVLANWAWGAPSLELARIGPMLPSAVGLIAIGTLLHLLDGGAPVELWVALFVALVSFGALYRVCSMSLGHPVPWAAAVFVACAFVVVMPFAIAQHGHSGGPKIRAQAPIPGRIDLVLVEPGPLPGVGSRPGAPPGDLAQWDVRYTVARPSASGKGLDVILAGTESRGEALRALRTGQSSEAGAGKIEWRPGAQDAVVLLPDTPPSGGSLVPAAESLGAPSFALLAGPVAPSLAEWVAWAGPRGGDAATFGEMEGPTPVDSALRLVATSRAALADRQLAYAYRPLLLFDREELYDWPVDVDAAFENGKVEMCRLAAVAGETNCPTVRRAADLDQSFDYLRVDPRGFSAADRERERHVPGTAYYYHAVPHGGKTYLDYWWYLPYNPSLSSWMCSLGFSLPEFDCFDHESDWEGVTVEVGPELGPPLAVYYAQHAGVTKRRWPELLSRWRGVPQRSMVEGTGSFHPLVFVAGDSHASYADPCAPVCVEEGHPLPEGSHNGGRPWPDDDDAVCAGLCLKPLPIARNGDPATWNAFSGTWGTRDCILGGAVCNRGEAPESPSFQWRYKNPGKTR